MHWEDATPSVVDPVSSAIWNVSLPPSVTVAVYSLGTHTASATTVSPSGGSEASGTGAVASTMPGGGRVPVPPS